MTGSATGSTSLAARSAEATTYLARVDAALADLPADDRGELLDELAAHLDELAAEGDGPLESRLGTPEEYAAELRSSAGLPPVAGAGRAARQLTRLAMRWEDLRRRPVTRTTAGFLGAVRPVWWVLRAWVLLGMLTWFGQPHWWPSLVVVPDVGPGPVSVLALVVAVVASVQLGRRGRPRSRAAAGLLLAGNVVLALGLWPVLLTMNEAVHTGAYDEYAYGATPEYVALPPSDGVWANDQQVWNVYAYDSAGTLLHDVRLYDQDGTPISLGLAPDGTRKPVVDGAGRLVQNAYPYRYVEADGTVADPDAGPPVDAPPLVGVDAPTETSPTPTPTPTPTAAPTADRER